MADTRGVFSLIEIVPIKLEDNWVPLTDVWVAPSPSALPKRYSDGVESTADTGRFISGFPGVSDKVTYSTDITTLAPGITFSNREHLAATGNSTHGYFGGGGRYSDKTSRMDKVSYSSDTSVQVPTAQLSSTRYYLAATGNSTKGYFGGGSIGPGSSNAQATMDKVTYSTDITVATPTANLSGARYYLAATGNQTAGYFGGGLSNSSRMDKLTYSTDTTVFTPSANLLFPIYALAATGNSTHGYFGGGAFYPESVMQKVTYASNTTTLLPGASLTNYKSNLAATGNSTAGYFGGGEQYPSILHSRMDKVIYSTDTTIGAPSASLSASTKNLAASSAKANGMSSIDPPAPTPTSTTYPYVVNTPNTGYFGEGASMDKLTYSTDTTVAVPGAVPSIFRGSHTATGNSTAGYFGGGWNAGAYGTTTLIDKLTYSTDTTVQSPTAILTTLRYYPAATGNSTNGYFMSGQQGSGSAQQSYDKITYSTDMAVRISTGTFTYAFAATGNSTHGYFGGGYGGSEPLIAVSKLSYSTDTMGGGTGLSYRRYGLAATGNSTHGYFGGGYGSGYPFYLISIMDKVTYSTDTGAATPTAYLSFPRSYITATGNSTSGYFSSGPHGSTLDKVTYSTDTRTTVSGANSIGTKTAGGTSARANGLPQPTYNSPSPNLV
jgi:hypothetical protein